MMSSEITVTLLSGFEGSVSVLLTSLAGYITTYYGLLDAQSVKHMSHVSSGLFLPALIIHSMGPELTVPELRKFWIMPLWGIVSSTVAHLLGWIGMVIFKLPRWTIVASGRANANALPLLLVKSLKGAGVLDTLLKPGESPEQLFRRARSIILLNAIIQQIFTFAIGPLILRPGNDSDGPASENDRDHLIPVPNSSFLAVLESERVGLLQDHDHDRPLSVNNVDEESPFPSPPGHLTDLPDNTSNDTSTRMFIAITKVFKRWTKKIYTWMNPPTVGAIVALILGIVPPLHYAFFDKDGIFNNTIMDAVGNLGDIFVSLQMFILGAQLAVVPSARPGTKSITYVLWIRYIIMPAISLGFVSATAGKGWYHDDPLMWFLLILVPCGPSAMLLISLAEMLNVDQGPIAGYLTISYLVSPLIAIVCSLALKVVDIAQKR